jgi:transposase
MGAIGAADPRDVAGWTTSQDNMRAAMNAILYLLRTGCPWRYLPRDSLNRPSVCVAR